MAWTTATKVRERAKQFTEAKGWGDIPIESRMVRAQYYIWGMLVNRYAHAKIAAWSEPAKTPQIVQDLCADLTIVEMMRDAYGEAQMAKDSPGGQLAEAVEKRLIEVATCQVRIVDVDGSLVEPERSEIGSTTEDREPTFRMGGKALSPTEASDLDEY